MSRVIAVDGPAASGKSSTATEVARALDAVHLDSGALYRAVTLVALDLAHERGEDGVDGVLRRPEAVLHAAEARGLALLPDGIVYAVYLGGEPAEARIRGATVTAHVSAVSAVPVIRQWINERLRGAVGTERTVVVDGRDIGTVVFPDARLKVYLTASPEVRAARRLAQRGEAGDRERLAAETALLARRDHADATRAVAPLRPAADAHILDSSALAFAEQVGRIVALARELLA